jgi:hypothetical protein
VLPYLGARILFGLEQERGSLVVGFFLQQTLGTARVNYSLERCGFFGCTTSQASAHDGGFSAGLSFGWSGSRTSSQQPSQAAPPG